MSGELEQKRHFGCWKWFLAFVSSECVNCACLAVIANKKLKSIGAGVFDLELKSTQRTVDGHLSHISIDEHSVSFIPFHFSADTISANTSSHPTTAGRKMSATKKTKNVRLIVVLCVAQSARHYTKWLKIIARAVSIIESADAKMEQNGEVLLWNLLRSFIIRAANESEGEKKREFFHYSKQ